MDYMLCYGDPFFRSFSVIIVLGSSPHFMGLQASQAMAAG